jgi:hypothetical protein
MNDYVDVSSFVADYDRSQANQAALTGDNIGDDDRLIDDGTDDADAE